MKNKKAKYIAIIINIVIIVFFVGYSLLRAYDYIYPDIYYIRHGLASFNFSEIKEMASELYMFWFSFLDLFLILLIIVLHIISWKKILREKENGINPLAFVLNSFVTIVIALSLSFIYQFLSNSLSWLPIYQDTMTISKVQYIMDSVSWGQLMITIILTILNIIAWKKYKKEKYKFGIIFSSIVFIGLFTVLLFFIILPALLSNHSDAIDFNAIPAPALPE